MHSALAAIPKRFASSAKIVKSEKVRRSSIGSGQKDRHENTAAITYLRYCLQLRRILMMMVIEGCCHITAYHICFAFWCKLDARRRHGHDSA